MRGIKKNEEQYVRNHHDPLLFASELLRARIA